MIRNLRPGMPAHYTLLSIIVICVVACANHAPTTGAAGESTNTGSSPTPATATAKPRFFVRTPENTNGNMGGASGADALCMSASAKPATGTFKALVVDDTRRACMTANCTSATENLNWVLAPNKTYYQADGTTVMGTTNAAGIFTFPITNGASMTVHGSFTGLNANWTNGPNCNNWISSSAGVTGILGTSEEWRTFLINMATVPCDSGMHILCVEQ